MGELTDLIFGVGTATWILLVLMCFVFLGLLYRRQYNMVACNTCVILALVHLNTNDLSEIIVKCSYCLAACVHASKWPFVPEASSYCVKFWIYISVEQLCSRFGSGFPSFMIEWSLVRFLSGSKTPLCSLLIFLVFLASSNTFQYLMLYLITC